MSLNSYGIDETYIVPLFIDEPLYVMGKKYVYCLLFLFCAIVLKVVELQGRPTSSSSEQNILIWLISFTLFQFIG